MNPERKFVPHTAFSDIEQAPPRGGRLLSEGEVKAKDLPEGSKYYVLSESNTPDSLAANGELGDLLDAPTTYESLGTQVMSAKDVKAAMVQSGGEAGGVIRPQREDEQKGRLNELVEVAKEKRLRELQGEFSKIATELSRLLGLFQAESMKDADFLRIKADQDQTLDKLFRFRGQLKTELPTLSEEALILMAQARNVHRVSEYILMNNVAQNLRADREADKIQHVLRSIVAKIEAINRVTRESIGLSLPREQAAVLNPQAKYREFASLSTGLPTHERVVFFVSEEGAGDAKIAVQGVS